MVCRCPSRLGCFHCVVHFFVAIVQLCLQRILRRTLVSDVLDQWVNIAKCCADETCIFRCLLWFSSSDRQWSRIFLPDAGHAFRQIYARVDWDVGFTYLAKRGSFGSTNTGIILFRSISDWTILFLENVRKGIPKKARGGENQRSIDLFIPHLKYNQIYQLDLDKLKQRHQIRILALQYPGPLNYNCIGCCELPPGIHVAHFKALKKNLALSSCCRDLAFPPTRNRSYMAQRMRGIWKESCECKQKHFSRPAFCMPSNKSNPIRNGTSWCKT